MTTTGATCAICGYDNVANTLFCEECGAVLAAPGAPAAQSAPVAVSQAAEGPTNSAPTARPARVERLASGALSARRASGGAEGDAEGRRSAGPSTAQGVSVPAPTPTAYLVTEAGRRIEVPAQDVAIVGREDMRSGIRPDVDLTLDGASAAGVSRRHCRLLRGVDGWRVEDLMSTNYTVLNGKALPSHTPTLLRDGDELRLGKLRLRFHHA